MDKIFSRTAQGISNRGTIGAVAVPFQEWQKLSATVKNATTQKNKEQITINGGNYYGKTCI